jgi:hypothetical protein
MRDAVPSELRGVLHCPVHYVGVAENAGRQTGGDSVLTSDRGTFV